MVVKKEFHRLENLQEIRLRAGKPLLLMYKGQELIPGNAQDEPYIVSKEEIDELLEYGVCDRETAKDRIKGYINRTCRNILENTAVFKNDDRGQNAFDKFLREVGFNAYRQEN